MSKNRFYYKNKNKKNNVQNQEAMAKNLANCKAKPEDLLRPIEDLKLSEHTYNALKAGKVSNLSDLACRSMQQMYRIQNIGKKNCIEISKALAKFGIQFAQDTQSPQNNQNNHNNQNQNNQKQAVQNKNNKPDNRQNNQDKQDNKQNSQNGMSNKNKKAKGENAQLNEYLSRLYEGMTINEIIQGKRERPVPQKIEKAPLTPDSLIKFCRKGKWGYKDWKGNVIIAPTYEEAFGFFEERGCVEKAGKLGYIDRNNNLVIDYKYDCATSFSEGLAAVTIGEKTGYIDVDGNQVIDFIYDVATPFSGGKAIVRQDDRWGVLSRDTLNVFWR